MISIDLRRIKLFWEDRWSYSK